MIYRKFLFSGKSKVSMSLRKPVLIAFLLGILFSTAAAFGGTGCIGDCTNDPPPITTMCNDGGDNDSDQSLDGIDGSDIGCVKPYYRDRIEGNIWDSTMTSMLEGGVPSSSTFTESLFFEGFVSQGNDRNPLKTEDTASGSSGSITVKQYLIEDRGTESKWYGFGERTSVTYSGFPEGTVRKGDRIIDPPNPIGTKTCGDGKTNEGEDELGTFDIRNEDSSSIDCKKDYGRLHDERAVESPFKEGSLQCKDDTPYCTQEGYNSFKDTSCRSGGCGETDRSSYESNYYWLVDQDGDVNDYDKSSCEVDGTTSTSCSDQELEIECSLAGCFGSCSPATYTCNAESRSFEDESSEYDCDNENLVDGGGDAEGRATDSIADNDPAGTWTDYRAFGDNTRNEVWCQAHKTRTVDADGPKGLGDGFVVLEDGEVVGKMSPDGSHRVGERVWFRGETLQDGKTTEYLDYTAKIEDGVSCPEPKDVCVAYVDFQTEEGEQDRGSPSWGGDEDWGSNSLDDAVNLQAEVFSLAKSYSACKLANYMEETDDDADDSEVIDCDYERGDSAETADVSPLPEACGDESNEHLILMEGYEVKYSNVKQNLKHAQKCVDWEEDSGGMGEDISNSTCVYNGTAYSEGTVLDINMPGLIYERDSTNRKSPDREVCLDPEQLTENELSRGISDDDGEYQRWDNRENSINSEDYGGEWYDLDNEMMNDYLNDEGEHLIDKGNPNDPHDIAYFYGENPNPYHSRYNPAGGKEGVALEDDCGPRINCDDTGRKAAGGANADSGLFYSFFSRLAKVGDDGY